MECTHVGQAVKVSSQLIQKIRKEKSTHWTCSSKIEIERGGERAFLGFWFHHYRCSVLRSSEIHMLSSLACRSTKSPWICLRCGVINCGRYFDKSVSPMLCGRELGEGMPCSCFVLHKCCSVVVC